MKTIKERMREYFSWSGRGSLCKGVTLIWDLTNLMKTRAYQAEGRAPAKALWLERRPQWLKRCAGGAGVQL